MKMVALALLAFFFVCADCDGEVRDKPKLSEKVEADAPLPATDKDARDELKQVRARERLLEGIIEDNRIESAQTKLWVGSGACWLAAVVLLVIALWTGRTMLIQFAVAAAGLGGLLLVSAWLVPYALIIGVGAVLVMAVVAVYMIRSRDKALTEVAAGVEVLKPLVPGYKDVFRKTMSKASDKLVGHIRVTRGLGAPKA